MKAVDRIIAKFGGISALAKELGHKHPTTVSQWKARGIIPARQQEEVLEAARRRDVPLQPADFFWVDPNPNDEHEVAPHRGSSEAA